MDVFKSHLSIKLKLGLVINPDPDLKISICILDHNQIKIIIDILKPQLDSDFVYHSDDSDIKLDFGALNFELKYSNPD